MGMRANGPVSAVAVKFRFQETETVTDRDGFDTVTPVERWSLQLILLVTLTGIAILSAFVGTSAYTAEALTHPKWIIRSGQSILKTDELTFILLLSRLD